MGFSKTEVNLRRLLAAAPQQQNRVKLIHHILRRCLPKTEPNSTMHYVATLREQLVTLVEETTPDCPQRISKAKVNDFSEKIEALAAKIVDPLPCLPGSVEAICGIQVEESPRTLEVSTHSPPSPRLRRRFVKLQEDLTDEMVGLAMQLKESSLMMSQSLQDTEKILDSTEKAVEHSLASTGHVNTQAMEVYSGSIRTTCFTWLVIVAMTCIFVMVFLLIRLT